MKINWNKKYNTYAIYACLVIFALVFLIFVGIYFKSVLNMFMRILEVISPVFYGFIIAYLLNPLANFSERKFFKKVKHSFARRGLAVTVTFIFVLIFVSLIFIAIIPQIGRSFTTLQTSLVTYSETLQKWLEDISHKEGIFAFIYSSVSQFIDISALSQPISYLADWIYKILKDFAPYITSFIGSFVVQFKNILVGILFSGYFLIYKEVVIAQLNKLCHAFLKDVTLQKTKNFLNEVDKTFGQYFLATLLDSIIVSVLLVIPMAITRMPYIPLIIMIIAITNIIPVIGPIIGTIPCFLFIFLSSPFKSLLFLIFVIVIQVLDGNIVKPRIIGQSTGMSAMLVFMSITVMGGLFGIVGTIISVPVFALISKFISNITEKKLNKKESARIEIVDDAIENSEEKSKDNLIDMVKEESNDITKDESKEVKVEESNILDSNNNKVEDKKENTINETKMILINHSKIHSKNKSSEELKEDN